MCCSPPKCLVRKQNPPKSSKFTICLTPSRKYQAEATATALNELGKGVAILGTWECGSSAARAKNLVMSPHQRRDTKNTREREREKKNQFIYLSVYLFVCLSIWLSICQRNQMHLFDIEHRICMDMSQTAYQPQPKHGLVASCFSSISLVASHPNTQLDTQHLLLPNRWKCISPRDAWRNGK